MQLQTSTYMRVVLYEEEVKINKIGNELVIV